MPAIFVYGTLKNPQNFKNVTGIHMPETIQASTNGKMVLYENAPVAFPDDEHEIQGLLLELPYELIQAIDTFEMEGRLFKREEVSVKTPNGEEKAYIYWGNPAHPAFYDLSRYEIVEDGFWEEQDFIDNDDYLYRVTS